MIRTSTETNDFAELLLENDGIELLLRAGEIEETWTERLSWRWLDESTLAFTDPDLAISLDWWPPRRYQEQRARTGTSGPLSDRDVLWSASASCTIRT